MNNDDIQITGKAVRELGVRNAILYQVLKDIYKQYKDDTFLMGFQVMKNNNLVEEYKKKYEGFILKDDYFKCSTNHLKSILPWSNYHIDTSLKQLMDLGVIDIIKGGIPNTRYVKIWEVS